MGHHQDTAKAPSRIDPAFSPILREGRQVHVEISGSDIIPLFLRTLPGGFCRVTLAAEQGLLLTRDTLDQVPRGSYTVFVYDRLDLARAAAKQMLHFGSMEVIDIGRSPCGDGVVIARGLASPCHGFGEMTKPGLSVMNNASHGMMKMEVVDFRDGADEGARPPEILLSVMIDRQTMGVRQMSGRRTTAPRRDIERGEAIARAVLQEDLPPVALRILQDRLEDIPGARVALSCLSASMVEDHLEDISEEAADCGQGSIDMPSMPEIHRHILKMTRSAGASGQERARAVAEALVRPDAARQG